ncbi:hypothetical protein GCM10010499_17530 [Streptomyces thermoviolaceus subsp. apingens]|nr:hypothetical protein GCM10010499_17530 [Streptomyces thermoviolaceus subsp. apingens]
MVNSAGKGWPDGIRTRCGHEKSPLGKDGGLVERALEAASPAVPERLSLRFSCVGRAGWEIPAGTRQEDRDDPPGHALIDATKDFQASAGKVSTGPCGTFESRTAMEATTGDLTSTHAPLPVEYEDLVHVWVAP